MEAEQMAQFTVPGYKVLIVDDNTVNRKVARSFLKDYQFELTEAASGLQAAELVQKMTFDLIFMDHLMPEMDGIETVRLIRSECGENGKSPVIIALTANAVEEDGESFLNSGFQDVLAKPLEKGRLNQVLGKWISDERKIVQKPVDNALQKQGSEFGQLFIQGIDKEAVSKYQSGTMSEYKELLALYCMDGGRKLLLLQELLDKKEYHTYEIEVHALKSASANIGAVRLSKLAQEQEEAAVRGDEQFILAHAGGLLSAYEEQLQWIQKFLAEQGDSAGSSPAGMKRISKEELRQELKKALEQLESFRSRECAARITKLQDCSLDQEIKMKLNEVSQQLKLYEDDEAERLLHNLLEHV